MSPLHSILLIVLLLAGCRQMPTLPVLPALTPYKIDIQQGNVVTQEMVAKLKPGMTQSQVRFILGTPLVVDAFHKDRWDYVYSYSKGGTVQQHRRIVVVFQDEKLARIEGDVLPAPPASTDEKVKLEKSAPTPVKPPAQETRPEATLPAQPNASNLSTSTGEPVTSGGAGAEAAGGAAKAGDEKPKPDNPRVEKPKEERGFFGRMLDKLRF
jgi:outer membrane protein assembly factor BamE